MLILFPLGPYEVTAIVVIAFFTFSHNSRELFFRCTGPPDASLYDLAHQIKVVSLAYIIVEVAFSNNGLNISVFLV
jgi:hypothetical protein